MLALLGVAQKSAQSDALAGLLQRGGELLAAGWQQTDGLREGLMDQFVNPYLSADMRVSDAERGEAADEVDAARKILQTGLARGEPTEAERRAARDHLARAVAKNPRNAQYLFELALVEQAMGELDGAHEHLKRATGISTSNPLFFHQFALVCEQLKRYDDALEQARRSEELAPENVEFVAHHAALCIESARETEDAERRSKLFAEARAELAALARLAPDHPLRESLTRRLDELIAARSGGPSAGSE